MQNDGGFPYTPYPYPFMAQGRYAYPQAAPGLAPAWFPAQPYSYSAVDLGQYTYPQNMPDALMLIQQAVAGETEDRMFYRYLIENAPTEEDKTIIGGIRDDEISHFDLFRTVYHQLAGQMLPPPQEVPLEKPSSYCEGLARAINGEQNAVRKYRRILYALQDRVQINILTGIITDEIRHGILYNYLYSRNGCKA
jgi:rubrerythrin